MNFDRVGFGAVIETDRTPRTSSALVLGVFNTFPVEAIGKLQACAGASLDAAATALAFIRENPRVGRGKPFIFWRSHETKIPNRNGSKQYENDNKLKNVIFKGGD
jgi:hypothetical protein